MTLTEALASYCSAPGLSKSTTDTARRRLNAWVRVTGSDALPDAASFAAFRSRALDSKLSPTTIEQTIQEVVRLAGIAGSPVNAGKPLRRQFKCRPVPQLEAVAKLYAIADQCQFPSRIIEADGTRTTPTAEFRADWLRAFLVLQVWTGFRIGDLLRLTCDSVTSDRIVWQASKTAKEHRLPMCSAVGEHLKKLERKRPTILSVGPGSHHSLLDELARLSTIAGVETITPQALRRASVTTWATVSPEAGRIVHGTGLGVLRHYYDGEQILRACADRFPWPASMLPLDQRSERQRLASETESVLARLSPERIADVLRVARAFAG